MSITYPRKVHYGYESWNKVDGKYLESFCHLTVPMLGARRYQYTSDWSKVTCGGCLRRRLRVPAHAREFGARMSEEIPIHTADSQPLDIFTRIKRNHYPDGAPWDKEG